MLRILFFAVGLNFAGGCHQPAWVESSPDGTFKVLVPQPLVEEKPPDIGKFDRVFSVSQKYGKYMIYLTDVVHVEDEKVIRESLERISNDLVEKAEAKLRYRHPFKLQDKYFAVDFEADKLERKMALRAFVIYARDRVFRVIVSGDRSWMTMAEVKKFLDSFQVIE
jgi:hypothetical protein